MHCLINFEVLFLCIFEAWNLVSIGNDNAESKQDSQNVWKLNSVSTMCSTGVEMFSAYWGTGDKCSLKVLLLSVSPLLLLWRKSAESKGLTVHSSWDSLSHACNKEKYFSLFLYHIQN